jgi:hypothetical protein
MYPIHLQFAADEDFDVAQYHMKKASGTNDVTKV